MLNSLPFILIIGTILGFLSGVGIGGGSLLILWLTLVLEIPQESARAINLLFFLPSALAACLFRRKQGNPDIRSILPAVVSGCLSAGIFCCVGMRLDTALLRKLFGFLLLFTGIRELIYRPKKKGS